MPAGRSKSAISEKELVIFELRKVLFSEKHLRELGLSKRTCLNFFSNSGVAWCNHDIWAQIAGVTKSLYLNNVTLLLPCSSYGTPSPVLENEEYSSQRWEAITPRESSIALVTSVQKHHTQEAVTATTSTGKRDTNDHDDENQLRSRARRRLEAGDIPRIPAAQKGKAKMFVRVRRMEMGRKVQIVILELINRGRKDQADARARKLQEQQYEAKQRQKRIHLAGRALFAMMVELGPDFGPVFSSTCDYLRTCIQNKRALAAAPQFRRQGPDIRKSGPSTGLMGYSQENLHAVSQAACAIAELYEKGYTMQDIMSVLFSPR